MSLMGSSLLCSSFPLPRLQSLSKKPHFFRTFATSTPPTPSSSKMAATSKAMNFGFKSLMETFSVDVHRAEGRPLNVPLLAPFTIASSRLEKVENVGIRVELSNGCVGWGEAPILPYVTAEDQVIALARVGEVCEVLRTSRAMTLNAVLSRIGELLAGHEFASVSIYWYPPVMIPEVTTLFRALATSTPPLSKMAAVTSKVMSFGFKSLLETFSVDVHRAEGRPLNVP
ncbi:hypothetical protein GIB67_028906 [Kingdonia uniflora]|uniref:Uncharacterized protein n=1 Tax=Kingdonia uniflora TaxID=39325 RepID=A0A7J7LTB6_9MAGN|nr:hypothetical protein GIB67_028906 [Kingdonia uniflora]